MEEFKRFLKKRGLTYKELAYLLKMSPTSVYRKMNGKSDFNLCQLARAKRLLGMSNLDFQKAFFG